jgi:hypothetical protein
LKNINECKLKKIMEREFNKSQKTPIKEGGKYTGDPRAHVIDEYDLISNNCTTKTMGAVREASDEPLYYNNIIYDKGIKYNYRLPLGTTFSPNATAKQLDQAVSSGSNAEVSNVTNEYK